MRAGAAAPRLRRQLLLWLMLPLLGVVAATGALGIYMAQRLTDRVFDRWLLDAAVSLAGQVRFSGGKAVVDLPPAATAMLSYDEIDRVHFSVVQGSQLLTGQIGIPAAGERMAEYPTGRAYDATIVGSQVRVAAARVPMPGGGDDVYVRVAETTRKRESARTEILLMLVPVGVLLLAAAAAIGYAVQRTLKPLEAIAKRWNEQSHVSLEPIESDTIPRELVPFATALNDLLSRIRSMLKHERLFAAAVAHQLRTPLTGLQLLVARASETTDIQSARSIFPAMADATQRAARLVQQLLALGRIEPESLGNAALPSTDLVALAHEVGVTFVDLAASRSIRLELISPNEPILVRLHADLMIEAIGNVLDNALRYSPAGGSVLIEFQQNPPTILVSDSGPGVPEAERERVFERFVRGSNVTGEGTGLGLAIVGDILAAHGAQVSIRTSKWGGACVVMTFPQQTPA